MPRVQDPTPLLGHFWRVQAKPRLCFPPLFRQGQQQSCGLWSAFPVTTDDPTSSLSSRPPQLVTSPSDLNNPSTRVNRSSKQRLPIFTHPCSGFTHLFAAETGSFLHLTPGCDSLEAAQLAGALGGPETWAQLLLGKDWLLPGLAWFMGTAFISHFQASKPQLFQPVEASPNMSRGLWANSARSVTLSCRQDQRAGTTTARVGWKYSARLQLP